MVCLYTVLSYTTLRDTTSVVANKLSVDGEIHFAGDVDWYVPRQSATACSFSAAGRDLDGDTATNDSASGLSMRLYDRNFGEPAAPNNRGSFRTSLSGVLLSGGEKLLEVTGTRAGGYKIIVTCEAPPAEISILDQSGRLSYPGYDDYRPSRNLNASWNMAYQLGERTLLRRGSGPSSLYVDFGLYNDLTEVD